MSGTGTIYFVRHGECRANVENMNLTPETDVITDKGKEQATLLGKHLQDVKFTRAYVSTFPRAQDTAQQIIGQLKTFKPEVQLDERIREKDLGEFENRPMVDLYRALVSAAKEKGTRLLEFEIQNGETVKAFENRVGSFLEEILTTIRESTEHQTILVVSHGVVIIRMLMELRLWSKEPTKALTLNSFSIQPVSIPLKNTGYHVLNVKTDKISTVIDIEKLHQTDHLEPLKPKVPVKPSKEMEDATKDLVEVTVQQCTTF